jgi:hypothetical protein
MQPNPRGSPGRQICVQQATSPFCRLVPGGDSHRLMDKLQYFKLIDVLSRGMRYWPREGIAASSPSPHLTFYLPDHGFVSLVCLLSYIPDMILFSTWVPAFISR